MMIKIFKNTKAEINESEQQMLFNLLSNRILWQNLKLRNTSILEKILLDVSCKRNCIGFDK